MNLRQITFYFILISLMTISIPVSLLAQETVNSASTQTNQEQNIDQQANDEKPVTKEEVAQQNTTNETQDQSAPQTEAPVQNVDLKEANEHLKSSAILTEGLVSLDFQDADIKNVLKVLAYKSNMNIVSGPEVTGNVTIQLNDVPWQKALEVLLTTYGFGYERKGNIITVATIENLKKRHENAQLLSDQEPLVIKTILLSFARAADVFDSINKMKTSRGQIHFDLRTNALIIRDVQSNVDFIEDVIKTLDTPTPQVVIEAKIIETAFSNTKNLGIDWASSLSMSGSARPTVFPFHQKSGSRFFPDAFPALSSTDDFHYGTLDATGLSAALQFLSNQTNTDILSNPQITTLDNQTAKIVVGLKYPLPSYTYNAEQGKLQISGYTFLDIGIIFEVTPHVNNADYVTLDLNPSITSIKALVQVDPTSTTAKIPELTTEEAKTKVMIKNGQTLVIAGLITQNRKVSNNKVPFLGDVPVMGNVFKKKDDTNDKTELIIFLTPHVIIPNKPDTASPAKSSKS